MLFISHLQVSGRCPYGDINVKKIVMQQLLKQWDFPEEFSRTLQDLLSGILEPTADCRMTIEDIQQSPWLADVELTKPLEVEKASTVGRSAHKMIKLLPQNKPSPSKEQFKSTSDTKSRLKKVVTLAMSWKPSQRPTSSRYKNDPDS